MFNVNPPLKRITRRTCVRLFLRLHTENYEKEKMKSKYFAFALPVIYYPNDAHKCARTHALYVYSVYTCALQGGLVEILISRFPVPVDCVHDSIPPCMHVRVYHFSYMCVCMYIFPPFISRFRLNNISFENNIII